MTFVKLLTKEKEKGQEKEEKEKEEKSEDKVEGGMENKKEEPGKEETSISGRGTLSRSLSAPAAHDEVGGITPAILPSRADHSKPFSAINICIRSNKFIACFISTLSSNSLL